MVFQYRENKICVSGFVISKPDNPNGLVSKSVWDKWMREGANLVQRGGNGRVSLVEFDTIPERYRELIKQTYGDPRAEATTKPFRDRIETDLKAVEYYSHYKLADGRLLPEKNQKQYAMNAAVLNAIKSILTDADKMRKKSGAGKVPKFWPQALIAVNKVRVDLNHTLPKSETKLRVTYKNYLEQGYEALISGKFCNDNSRKVSSDLERLMMSLYTMPNKPFGADVHNMITLFLAGKLQVADSKTGELFNPEDFYMNGKPVEVSRSTVWNYLNNPDNRSTVDIKRNGRFEYNSMHRPHHHRTPPFYSLSKITMDDRDLPRRLKGGGRVKAYYVYDVASGSVIGRAYSRNKDEELFLDCLRDMFRLIKREGLPMPGEVEVEHHLVSKFFDDLGVMFPFLRICNPGNSQEKHAEHLNRAKKYGIEKKKRPGIGRWWAHHEAYRVDNAKIDDQFVEKDFDFDTLVADDIADTTDFNNQLHPRKKRYPNKTRWQVLLENLNPKLFAPNEPLIQKSIGNSIPTSITRNQYVTVQYAQYSLPSPDIMKRLQPGNYKVQAYYLPDQDGVIPTVYLYQNGVYLCQCERIDKYNTAKIEQTEKDVDAYREQAKYVSQFDKRKKDLKNSLHNPVIVTEEHFQPEPEIVTHTPIRKEATIEELINDYNPDEYAERAINDL